MLTSFVRRSPIVVLCTTLFLTICGCSEPGPVEDANDEKPQEVAVIAPTFAPHSGRASAPAGTAGGEPADKAGPKTTLFTSEPTTGPGGQPVLYPGRLSWYDPLTKEPCGREIGVASNGDVALLEPLSTIKLQSKSTGPTPTQFPIHALITWFAYPQTADYRKAAVIESLDIVRISGDVLHASAPQSVVERPAATAADTERSSTSTGKSAAASTAINANSVAAGSGFPVTFTRGQQFELPLPKELAIIGATLKLVSAPTGMALSPEGKLSWKPSADAPSRAAAVVEISRPSETRRFHVVRLQADTAIASEAPEPRGKRREYDSMVKLAKVESDRFDLNVHGTAAAFIIERAQVGSEEIVGEAAPIADTDGYAPPGATVRLTLKHDGAEGRTAYRMPDRTHLFVRELRTPFRLVKAQGRPVESVESSWIGMPKPDAVVRLAESASDATPAGDGRYLLLSQPTLRKVAVFDVRAGKLKEYVDTDSSDFIVAGGLTRFVVIDRASRKLQRFNLATLASEKTGTLPSSLGRLLGCGMGVRSEGPIYFAHAVDEKESGLVGAVDLESLLPRNVFHDADISKIEGECEIDVSADGDIIACDDARNDVELLTLIGDRFRLERKTALRSDSWFRLAQNGEDFFGHQRRYFGTGETLQFAVFGSHSFAGDTFRHNLWFAAAYNQRTGIGHFPIQFYFGREPRPVARVSVAGGDFDHESPLRFDRRVHCAIPEKAIAVICDYPPRISLTRYDLDTAIAADKSRPLVAASAPPKVFPLRRNGSYQLDVAGNPIDTSFKLVAGPTDMIVSPTGLVGWRGTAENESSYRGAIIMVSDKAGRKFAHGLRLPSSAADDVTNSSREAAPAEKDLAAGLFFPLPSMASQHVVVGNGRYMLLALRPCQKVAMFDLHEGRFIRFIETGTTQFLVTGGATRMVVVDTERREFRRYRLETGAPEMRGNYVSGPDPLVAAVMGSNSEGPLLIWDPASSGNLTPVRAVGLETLKAYGIDVTKSKSIQKHLKSELHSLSISDDGSSFAPVWPGDSGVFETAILQLSGNQVVGLDEFIPASPKSRISGDGRAITDTRNYFFEGGLEFKLDLHTSGNYSDALWWSQVSHPSPDKFTVCFHRGRSLEKLAQLDLPRPPGALDVEEFAGRTYYSQQEKMLAVVYDVPNLLYVKRFNADAEIAKNAVDHIAFTSLPHGSVKAGDRIQYQLTAISSDPQLTFGLDTKLPGMTVSPSGLLEWTVPTGAERIFEVQVTATNTRKKQISETCYFRIGDSTTPTRPGPGVAGRPQQSGPALSAAAIAAAKSQPRKWTNYLGVTMVATFVERKGDVVILKPTGKKAVEVGWAELSESDRALVERIAPEK